MIALAALVAGAAALVYVHDEASTTNAGRSAGAVMAAAEAAVGLAIVIALFRQRESLNPEAFTSLKW